MNQKLLLILLIQFAIFVGTYAKEDIEPSLGYTVYVNDESIHLTDEDTVKLKGQFLDPVIRVVKDNERTFNYGGVSFCYPAYFSFEADINKSEYKNWTLSGNDVKIVVFSFEAKLTPDDLISSYKDKFGKDAKTSNTRKKLGGISYEGKRIEVKIADAGFIQEAFLISQERNSKILVIQDSIEEDKQSMDETNLVNSLLDKTFRDIRSSINTEKKVETKDLKEKDTYWQTEVENRINDLESRVLALESKPPTTENVVHQQINFSDKWKDISLWRYHLQKGMKKDAVVKLLGEPDKVEVYNLSGDVWHYGYPSGGDVNFDTNGKLKSWSEPHL
jgi:hypothetical protein